MRFRWWPPLEETDSARAGRSLAVPVGGGVRLEIVSGFRRWEWGESVEHILSTDKNGFT